MAIETINIKYKIPKLTFKNVAPQEQIFRLEVRKESEEDSNYITVSDSYSTDIQGNNINNISVNNLDEDTVYRLKFTNQINQKVFTKTFRTAVNFSVGESPLWFKKLYAGQTLDWYTNGLLDSSLPPNYQGYYYILAQNYRDAYEGFSNSEPQNGMKWEQGINYDNNTIVETGMSISDGRYLALNNTHPNVVSRVNSAQMFDYDASRSFSIFLMFFNKSGVSKTIISTGSGANKFKVYIDGDGKVVVEFTKDGVTKSTLTERAIQNNKWYNLELRVNLDHPNYNGIFLHGTDNIPFVDQGAITATMKGTDEGTVYLGYDSETEIASENLIVKRLYYGTNPDLDNNSRYRLLSPNDYLPKLMFKRVSDDVIFTNPVKWLLKLDNAVMSITVDTGLPLGDYDMYIQTSTNVLPSQRIEIVEFKSIDSFDINFEDDFENAINEFKEIFAGFHSQWGGANGGVNGNLIYANRDNGLIFENHGDNYNGEVVGVQKPPKNSDNRGYGANKIHDIPNDPKYGQDWKERVGAVAVTKGYAGYGEWSTWMKVPVGSYGYAPALWFFHYQELYETDERYNYWLNRGGKPYGGSDPYMVINHEIDMELPSHIAMGVFAEWNEVSNAYFDQLALDTQYHIAVEDTSSPARYGLFKLNDINNPNSFSSWTKVADSWDITSTPKFSNCKFNNWIGEKAGGSGWAYTEEDYKGGEEYLALLTKLEKSYADGEFHKWTIKWYRDKTELWIDDVFIRENRAFVPFICGRITLGGWFPSAVTGDSETPWQYSPVRAWAGYPANFDTLNMEVKRISYRRYDAGKGIGAGNGNPDGTKRWTMRFDTFGGTSIEKLADGSFKVVLNRPTGETTNPAISINGLYNSTTTNNPSAKMEWECRTETGTLNLNTYISGTSKGIPINSSWQTIFVERLNSALTNTNCIIALPTGTNSGTFLIRNISINLNGGDNLLPIDARFNINTPLRTDGEASGVNELFPETYPEAGLREFL